MPGPPVGAGRGSPEPTPGAFALRSLRRGPDAAHGLMSDPYRLAMPAHSPLGDTPSTALAAPLLAAA